MRVFVTGATGLVGAHTALELLNHGHQVKLLVRNRDTAERYFRQRGFDTIEYVVGDMLDAARVKKGLSGCDGVIHAAAAVDLNAKNAAQTRHNNLNGMRSVIDAAVSLGIPKIIYVSSLSVLFQPNARIDETTALTSSDSAYTKSKSLCESYVRDLQARGEPVTIVYPSSVYSPHDPKLAESNSALTRFIKSIVPITSSGMQFVDARDLARAKRLLLEKPNAEDMTDERYMIGGHFVPWREFADLLESAHGSKLTRLPVPGPVFRFLGLSFDLARKLVPIEYPISREAMAFVTQFPVADSSKIINEVGLDFRPPRQTFKDTLDYFKQNGTLN